MGFLPVKFTLAIGLIFTVATVHARPSPSDAIYFPDDLPEHTMPVFDQSAASNTGTQTIVGKDGSVQQATFGGSQSANIASDLSSGQLSSTNTQQQTIQSGDKYQSQTQGQGQSASFGTDHQALSNVNTGTNVVREGANVREKTTGGSASSIQTALGSQASQAHTDSETFKEAGKEGSRTTGSSTSQNIRKDGTGSASDAKTGSERIVLADGTVITSSHGSSFSFQTSNNKKASAMAQSTSSSFSG